MPPVLVLLLPSPYSEGSASATGGGGRAGLGPGTNNVFDVEAVAMTGVELVRMRGAIDEEDGRRTVARYRTCCSIHPGHEGLSLHRWPHVLGLLLARITVAG